MSDVMETDGDGTSRRPRMSMPSEVAGVPLRKFTLIVTLSLVLAGGLGFGVLHTKLCAVDRIDVRGLTTLEAAGVLDRSGVKTGQFLVQIDGGAVEAKLKTDPWIASASVDRKWPQAITISVRERTPVAIAQTADKKWALIGDGGVVLEVTDLPRPGLPYALDVEAPSVPGQQLDPKAENLVKIAAIMPESLQPRVVQMQEKEDGVRLGLDGGTVVMLGPPDNLAAKLMSAAAVISKSDPTKIALLDVTSPESPLATPVASVQPKVSTSTSTTNSAQTSSEGGSDKASTSEKKVSTSTTAARAGTSSSSPPGAGGTSKTSTSTTIANRP